MSNPKEQVKVPRKEGLAEVRKRWKELRQIEPSDELVKIIQEVTEIADQIEREEQEKNDIAARPARGRGMNTT
jgi:uncharacterized protein YydD (DUF2326 family)